MGLDDRHAIKALIDRYSDAVTRRDFDCVATLFADDAVWQVGPPFNLRLEGAGIAQGLAALLGSYDLFLQAALNSVIDLADGRAAARTTIFEMGKATGSSFTQFGIYQDVIERRGERWCFAARTFHPVYRDDAPLTGTVFELALGA